MKSQTLNERTNETDNDHHHLYAFEVITETRYINYLLTYLLTYLHLCFILLAEQRHSLPQLPQ